MPDIRQFRLRFIDAADILGCAVELDGLPVYSVSAERLGEIDGFIVDAHTGSPYYAVVDSGGWFRTRRYMVPVGHLAVDGESARAFVDFGKKTIESFPPFDFDRFEEVPDEDLRNVERQILNACSPAPLGEQAQAATVRDDGQSAHDRAPGWWPSLFSEKEAQG